MDELVRAAKDTERDGMRVVLRGRLAAYGIPGVPAYLYGDRRNGIGRFLDTFVRLLLVASEDDREDLSAALTCAAAHFERHCEFLAENSGREDLFTSRANAPALRLQLLRLMTSFEEGASVGEMAVSVTNVAADANANEWYAVNANRELAALAEQSVTSLASAARIELCAHARELVRRFVGVPEGSTPADWGADDRNITNGLRTYAALARLSGENTTPPLNVLCGGDWSNYGSSLLAATSGGDRNAPADDRRHATLQLLQDVAGPLDSTSRALHAVDRLTRIIRLDENVIAVPVTAEVMFDLLSNPRMGRAVGRWATRSKRGGSTLEAAFELPLRGREPVRVQLNADLKPGMPRVADLLNVVATAAGASDPHSDISLDVSHPAAFTRALQERYAVAPRDIFAPPLCAHTGADWEPVHAEVGHLGPVIVGARLSCGECFTSHVRSIPFYRLPRGHHLLKAFKDDTDIAGREKWLRAMAYLDVLNGRTDHAGSLGEYANRDGTVRRGLTAYDEYGRERPPRPASTARFQTALNRR